MRGKPVAKIVEPRGPVYGYTPPSLTWLLTDRETLKRRVLFEMRVAAEMVRLHFP